MMKTSGPFNEHESSMPSSSHPPHVRPDFTQEEHRARGESDLLQFFVAAGVAGGLFFVIFTVVCVVKELNIFDL